MSVKGVFFSVCVLAASFSNAAEARVRYTGVLVVTGVSGICDYNPTGDEVIVRFHPANVDDNGVDSGLGLTYDDYTDAYVLAGGSFGPTYKTVTVSDVGALAFTGTAKVKFTTQVPVVITNTSDYLHVTGAIKGYDGMPDCVVSFNMAATRRIN